MTKTFTFPPIGVQAKVLIPMIAVLVVSLALFMIVAGQRIQSHIDRDMTRRLVTSDAVFKTFQSIRVNNLLLRYRNIPDEPRFKAVVQLAEPKTLRFSMSELVTDLEVDAIIYSDAKGDRFESVSRQPAMDRWNWDKAIQDPVQRALTGLSVVDVAQIGNRLFDIVSVPVIIGSSIEGVLSFANEIGDDVARELKQLADCDITFLADDRVVASTLGASIGSEDLVKLSRATGGGISKTLLGGDHFLVFAGEFAASEHDGKLRYLLLSSYEDELRALKTTKRSLMIIGLLAILLGCQAVWILVRRATNPLRQLRDSAEAVGRGDFSMRVPVLSRDECGDLAMVFNQMTGNLQVSRQELEKTVVALKRTQEQLVQSEKLSAIGEFVAGVTHELNNPLTSVLGYAELLMQTTKDESQMHDAEAIVTGAKRCQKIVQNLLSFARQHKFEKKRANINTLITNVLEFMQYDLHTSNVTIVKRLDPELPATLVEAHQMQQVFVNIIHNARQAMDSYRPDGALMISTERHDHMLRITFQDNGPGIPAEYLNRIFDPFFTTKPVGTGTGLGLSLSYGIVKEHGGTIRVESKPGLGATFVVEIPIATGAELPAVSKPSEDMDVDGHGRRVLIVDDEVSICGLVSQILTGGGYVVESVETGAEAVQRILHRQYDLIVCDLKMPGLSGRQVFERVLTFDPECASRFLFMTGDIMNRHHQDFFKKHGLTCLPKPFSIEEFRTVVHRAAPA